jgi:hypothetical protein
MKSRRRMWARNVARMGEMHTIFWDILVRISEGKKPSEKPRHKCENSIGVVLKETWQVGVDWMNLAQNRGKLHGIS